MYAKKDTLEMFHDEVKRMHRLSSRPIVTHSKVCMPAGMTGGAPTFVRTSDMRVTEGDRSKNIRQVYHF
jgi:hypothetical protein